jgi:hypothetical protein
MPDTLVSRTTAAACALLILLCSAPVLAEDFVVTTLRAAPGKLDRLIKNVKAHREERRGRVIIMRHSQGDHWDLMLLEPTGENPMVQPDFSGLADFQHSFLVESGETFKGLNHQAHSTGLYHVEMFQALAGKRQALIDQRQRENQYLAATGQVVNAVFTTSFGSDVDVFTVGFHEDLAAMARGPTVSDGEAEAAARDAGFKSRGDIGLFLRSLIISHHDTLAVPVD